MKKTAIRRKSPKTKTRKNKRQKKHRKNLKRKGGFVDVTGAIGTVGTGFTTGFGLFPRDNRSPEEQYCDDYEHKSKNFDGSIIIKRYDENGKKLPSYNTCINNRKLAKEICLNKQSTNPKCIMEEYLILKTNSSCKNEIGYDNRERCLKNNDIAFSSSYTTR